MTRARVPPFRILALFCCLTAAGCIDAVPPPPTATGQPIAGSTGYPRLVRLLDPAGVSSNRLLAASGVQLFESDDHGAGWHRVGQVASPAGGWQLRCCEALAVLPRPVGILPTGTLLFAASYWNGAIPAIAIFSSADLGRSWTYRGAPVVRGAPGHGLWEPEFEIAADGALVMLWSDETDPAHSQKLVQIRTRDGTHWGDETDTVASSVFADRPGMATVSRSRGGQYVMTYEVCGPSFDCAVFSRASADGWNFGDPRQIGTKVQTRDGTYLHSAPVHVWSPSRTAADGELVVVAKRVLRADGSPSPLTGTSLFVNRQPDGSGVWTAIDAPVQVPSIAEKNACQNYSSALLPASDGSSLLELAGDFAPDGTCTVYAGRGPLDPSGS